ncbi:MAG: hypothetical protein AAGE59_07500 [Cyanobacteria bacterium P01_F01_bin.86]
MSRRRSLWMLTDKISTVSSIDLLFCLALSLFKARWSDRNNKSLSMALS